MNDTVKRTKRVLSPALVFHTDIVLKKATGIYVEDTNGKRYMDFTSGLATLNAGYSHPQVIKAIEAQAKNFTHSGCIFYYEQIALLAEKLKEKTPSGIDMFFFSNSGAEAIEGAIKLARFSTGRQSIIAFTGGFHGRTLGALSLTSSAARYRKNYQPLLPGVYHAPYPYCYRCPLGKLPSDCGMECFRYLERMLEHLITPEEVACVVIEPILGEGGYVVPPVEYMKKLRELTSRHGILFVADEVQTGFGRTGKWFAIEQHFGIKPDIMTMAKAIASGMPLGAIAARKELMEKWSPGAHGTTFGGNPISCAAAIATIDVIEKESLVKNSKTLGDYTLKKLNLLKKKFPFIGDVRGLGLMLGVEFVKKDKSPDGKLLKDALKKCEKMGLIIIECGRHKNIARLMPPLTTTIEEMDKALDIFEKAIKITN